MYPIFPGGARRATLDAGVRATIRLGAHHEEGARPLAGWGIRRKDCSDRHVGEEIWVWGVITQANRPAPGLPRREIEAPWALPPPGGAAVAALLAGLALLLRSERTHGFLAAAIDGFDLVVHEAGHPLLGLLGWRFLAILGGTLLQLTPPLVSALVFARRRQTASVAAVVVWLGVNLVNVGQYAADAQARALPLLNADADGHDWWNMLRALGLLEHCHAIGGAIGGLGWALQVLAPAWAAALWLRWRLVSAAA